MVKKLKFILGSISLGSVIAIVPAVVISCSSDNSKQIDISTNQVAINSYIKAFESNKDIKAILPSTITATTSNISMSDITKYFSGIVTPPSGITATFNVITTPSLNANGQVELKATLSGANATTQTSTPIIIGGFLKDAQPAINAYITTFESNTKIKANNTILPSNITPTSNISMTDIAKYFSDIATPAIGITATFNVITTSSSDINGQVELTVTLSAANATTQTSKPITITGFLTTKQIQTEINAYINAFENNSNIKTLNNSNLPSGNISMTGIAKYFSGIATPPSGITATFNILNIGTYTLSLQVTVSGANTTKVGLTLVLLR